MDEEDRAWFRMSGMLPNGESSRGSLLLLELLELSLFALEELDVEERNEEIEEPAERLLEEPGVPRNPPGNEPNELFEVELLLTPSVPPRISASCWSGIWRIEKLVKADSTLIIRTDVTIDTEALIKAMELRGDLRGMRG